MTTTATTFTMPSETAPQDKVWMAFPCEGYSLGDDPEAKHEARSTWLPSHTLLPSSSR